MQRSFFAGISSSLAPYVIVARQLEGSIPRNSLKNRAIPCVSPYPGKPHLTQTVYYRISHVGSHRDNIEMSEYSERLELTKSTTETPTD